MDKTDKTVAFWVALVWVALWVLLLLVTVILLVYAFRTDYFNSKFVYYVGWVSITFMVFRFGYKRKNIIMSRKKKVPLWKDLAIILFFIFNIFVLIYCMGVNREKIYAERKIKFPIEQPIKQNSLENRIRDWWNNR
ncbi:MAG: hypothetical protein LBV75_03335 [Paludibacter sp.]|jgi:hypothetical protein|nr:hypothetical protein [Paludibacter sp.]